MHLTVTGAKTDEPHARFMKDLDQWKSMESMSTSDSIGALITHWQQQQHDHHPNWGLPKFD